MKYYTLLALLATTSAASINMADQIAHEFRMALLPRQQVNNLQAFTSGLGGVRASAITQSNDPTRQFEVDGDTFVGCSLTSPHPPSRESNRCRGLRVKQDDYDTAANRACDNQHNECADKANNGDGSFTVADCDQQTSELPTHYPLLPIRKMGETLTVASSRHLLAQCKAAINNAPKTSFLKLVSSDDQFDIFCDS